MITSRSRAAGSARDARVDIKENKVGATTISKYDYAVNNLNQRDGVASSGSAFGPAKSVAWKYDALGQVVAADATGNSTIDYGYAYDEMGNRKRSSKGTINTSTAAGSNLAIYRQPGTSAEGGSNLNQYGSLELYGAPATNNTYDDDGNQQAGSFPATTNTSTSTNERGYDGENQLISTTVNGFSPTLYTYDAYHRRVAKQKTNTDVEITVYDDWNPIADYTLLNSSCSLQTSYSWSKDLSGAMQGAGGVGGLLAVQKFTGTTGTYFPTYDGNGNISEYLDTTGAIVAHYEYGPFGEQVSVSGNYSAFKHRFSTKPLDAESGYYYYGYRSYDPLSGRWVNRDPLGELGGVNLYGMVNNFAIGLIDYLGTFDVGKPIPGFPPEMGNYLGESPGTNCASYHMCPKEPAFNLKFPKDPNAVPEPFGEKGCRKAASKKDCKKSEKHVKIYWDKTKMIGDEPARFHAVGETTPGSGNYSQQVGAGKPILDGIKDPDKGAFAYLDKLPKPSKKENVSTMDMCCKCSSEQAQPGDLKLERLYGPWKVDKQE